jgi:hypothetical protein
MLINFEMRGDKPIFSVYPFFIMGEEEVKRPPVFNCQF